MWQVSSIVDQTATFIPIFLKWAATVPPPIPAEEVAGMLSGVVCAYEFSDPLPDDNVPVLLENNRFARNFEKII